MSKVNLTRFIIPVKLDNLDECQRPGDKSFQTEDLVYIESSDELSKFLEKGENAIQYPTDYAIMNGALISSVDCGDKNKKSCLIWLRDAASDYDAYMLDTDGHFCEEAVFSEEITLCPALHLNLSSIISERKRHSDFFKISEIKTKGSGKYHTIEFGEYPKTYVGDRKNKELEKLYSLKRLGLTGKTYTGRIDNDGKITSHSEFEYEGQKYVRVLTETYDNDSEYSDGTKASEDGTYLWAKVEPIVWKIKNWDEMPTSINPEGNGKAKFIDVRTDEAIISGIPFYPYDEDLYSYDDDENYSMWQNSTIRGYLNGINVNNIKTNGNTKYTTPNGGNFRGKNNFLAEALNIELSKTLEDGRETDAEIHSSRKSRLEKLNPDKTPLFSRRRMTDTEIIKSWIDAGQSVLLRGPSGIGKTERIKKLYPDLIYIKLTNNMFPEKVVGSMNLQTGQSIPPDFAKQALMSSATDDERKLIKENIQNLYDLADTIYERSKSAKGKTVIMLDELLNVKPAVQSLVYTLVLNKLVETGKGLKLPANTVVVATGNQKKYSAVAEDLAEPLEKRFDHILDMEPKVSEWIYEFAIPNNIHPSVIGYIFSKYQENRRSESLQDMGYFYEEPEVGEENLDKNGCRGRTNDPRGWVSISNTLYAFEEDLRNGKFVGKDVENLLKVTIGSKLREEWAGEFFDFYNHPTLTVEDIVNKTYSQADLPQDINEKFATISNLLSANFEQVGICREFISKHCDPEYLSVYDIYWAGNDEKRMEKIAELQEISMLKDEGALEL